MSCMTQRDHLGNEYPSIAALARAWDVDRSTLKKRLDSGWDMERALTTPPDGRGRGNPVPCSDHLGNEFPSEAAMCRAWGLGVPLFRYRTRQCGWDLERALSTPPARVKKLRGAKPCVDHEGNGFPSVRAMCRHWDVPTGAYYARLRAGWDLKEVLTRPCR